MDLGHWAIQPDVVITEDTFGFIYEICNTVNGKNILEKNNV